MDRSPNSLPNRILIVSSHPLFGHGLKRLLQTRAGIVDAIVCSVSSDEEALHALEAFRPDLAIIDYDDEQIQRQAFMAYYAAGGERLRVVLLSLKESSSEAIVYDRRTLEASRIEDWL